jgi:hypothetical protein
MAYLDRDDFRGAVALARWDCAAGRASRSAS